MNRAVESAAEARVDDVLPVQWSLGEMVGFPEDRPALQQLHERRRLGGRPAGARNKRLAEVAQLVRERFGDVLLQQVALATMPVADLVALGLKPLEALQEKRLSAATVLPYLEQKKPISVDVTGRSVVYLDIQIGADEGQGNQGFADGLVLQLDSAQLDGTAKALDLQGEVAGGQLMMDQSASGPSGQARVLPPATRARPPGGAVFGPVGPLHAPATVVYPEGAVFEPAGKQGDTGPGVGEGA